MIPMTTRMISVSRNEKLQWGLLVSPSPGSTKLNVVPTKQFPDQFETILVSNNHLLIQFKSTKQLVHTNLNGIRISQKLGPTYQKVTIRCHEKEKGYITDIKEVYKATYGVFYRHEEDYTDKFKALVPPHGTFKLL